MVLDHRFWSGQAAHAEKLIGQFIQVIHMRIQEVVFERLEKWRAAVNVVRKPGVHLAVWVHGADELYLDNFSGVLVLLLLHFK